MRRLSIAGPPPPAGRLAIFSTGKVGHVTLLDPDGGAPSGLGLWHPGPVQSSSLTGVVAVVIVLATATAFGWWRRRHDGRLRAVAADTPHRTALTALGVRPGTVTLVQFSAPVCAPCRAARRVLDEVVGRTDGVTLLEVEVTDHLDHARELDVWRTPTVLVVDAAGRIARRASGVPARDELLAALAPLLGARA